MAHKMRSQAKVILGCPFCPNTFKGSTKEVARHKRIAHVIKKHKHKIDEAGQVTDENAEAFETTKENLADFFAPEEEKD